MVVVGSAGRYSLVVVVVDVGSDGLYSLDEVVVVGSAGR